jgi:hypothetical protein
MKKILFFLVIMVAVFFLSLSFRTLTVDDELIRISQEYNTYTLYSSSEDPNSPNYKWAISLCEPMYSHGVYGDTLHISAPGENKSPHGNKLYKLYIKDWEAYSKKTGPQPEGQVLIKEVWNVRAVDFDNDSIGNYTLPVMRSLNDGLMYTPTTRKQLFIMYKTAATQENDNGWWYGIVDIEKGAEKATVIESMKINRCVKCHAETKYDRIFGAN